MKVAFVYCPPANEQPLIERPSQGIYRLYWVAFFFIFYFFFISIFFSFILYTWFPVMSCPKQKQRTALIGAWSQSNLKLCLPSLLNCFAASCRYLKSIRCMLWLIPTLQNPIPAKRTNIGTNWGKFQCEALFHQEQNIKRKVL